MKKLQTLAIVGAAVLMFAQCGKLQTSSTGFKTPTLPETAPNYAIKMPTGVFDNTPTNNRITNDGAQLGRVLFFDKALSINNSKACGSCHLQSAGFADVASTSIGFEGKRTSRNSMSIINAANERSYFWDGRTEDLETMVLQPVRHQVEMGIEKMEILPAKLKAISYYPPLFKKAFGSEEITKEKIGLALAQFIRSMSSYAAPVDESDVANTWGTDINGVLSPSQQRGAQLFFNQAQCASCHIGTNFRGHGDHDVANIGLDKVPVDKGIFDVTGKSSDMGVFRVPSLRNIALTGPYMHDGRFATLRDVINHYNKNVQANANLDPRLTDTWSTGGEPRQLNLSEGQINDLIDFLQSFTDNALVSDPKFSDPFAGK